MTDQTFILRQPIVTTGDTIKYDGVFISPAILFKTRDNVTITAGGCVQTGGSGKTWKRYVNPSGPDSDRLYHGEIYIPGIAPNGMQPSLIAIRDYVHFFGAYNPQIPGECTIHVTIPNIDGLPEADRFFMTRYVDDNYDDNGYWGHDDGTEDQCKNTGDAYIVITINR